ncbi:hypothetical protein KDD93_00875 [Campylobacter sp. faydin G-24]|uniref:Uncharacterized protein n=1 Tax=Campylobacter anatolicus TaxID=2829105 RepID=A0ABS5HGA5_9BACT|nr:hypothetical protein [Campylobacter anatolicus]MBR8463127.1 hypothetical protein [Campylobacter anatolicus]
MGFKQKFEGFEICAKYIDRKGKDQVIKATRRTLNLPNLADYQTSYQTFTNDGKGESKVLTPSLKV